jgi:hypothetical protein
VCHVVTPADVRIKDIGVREKEKGAGRGVLALRD